MSESNTLVSGARRRAAEAVISEAADLWSRGVGKFQPTDVLAAFVHALGADVGFESTEFNQGSTTIWNSNPYGTLPTKPLSEWQTEVSALDHELVKLAPGVPHQLREGCRTALLALCNEAAGEWGQGDPENPPTAGVAMALARILFDSGCYLSWDWRRIRP